MFSGIFGGASIVITLYLWRHDRVLLGRRVSAGAAAETEPVQKTLQALAALAFAAELLVPAFDRRYGGSSVPPAVSLAADVAVIVGFALVFAVFGENSFTAATICISEGQRVVTPGPYAVVRHPMYAGALGLLLGTPVALGSWWGLLAFGPMLVVIAVRLVHEEHYLSQRLAGYADYCRVVRFRLLPRVW